MRRIAFGLIWFVVLFPGIPLAGAFLFAIVGSMFSASDHQAYLVGAAAADFIGNNMGSILLFSFVVAAVVSVTAAMFDKLPGIKKKSTE